ncbi:MAG TPA: 4Fe-4S dicluster domain-containing protein [Candidatus Tenderia sp.]|nr:4Fe-4S dicluster domain-containing protein [Candidatus Tenderia sp.]
MNASLESLTNYAFYFVPLLLIWLGYVLNHHRKQRVNIALRDAAKMSGMSEPASLHPSIDVSRCIGCGSCAAACPEGKVLGVINGKAELIKPSGCIGHGACKIACPEDAITLVFGTEKRGVDIPNVQPNFETNVSGLFIAGELGGMGLIRNAIEQGKQAMDSIKKVSGVGQGEGLDVFIVGAGPAGFAASLAAKAQGLRYVTIEQDSLGGTVAHFPRGKIVMTAPVEIPLVGKVKLTETTKEALLDLWQGIERDIDIGIQYQERLEQVEQTAMGFDITTSKGTYRSRTVLLAIGRRGTPRKLGVPGEASSKVVYRLIDPAQYRGQHVLVVGGGDSAIEAATSIAEEADTTVTISYRSEAFSRAKEKNRQRVEAAREAGRLRVLMSSQVKSITDKTVALEQGGEPIEIANDAVIICAGGILPTPFLKKIGIEVETKYGTA